MRCERFSRVAKTADEIQRPFFPAFAPRCLKIEEWPRLHGAAWERAFTTGGLFDEPGLASTWRSSSADKTRKGYGAWIHWLRTRSGDDPAVIEAGRPEDLVIKNIVLAYVDDLSTVNSSMTVLNRIAELYDAIRVMAPPASEWTWLKAAERNLRARAKPSRDKLARLQSAEALEALGMKLIAEAEAAPERNHRSGTGMTALQRALAFRDGLMIALLVRRPFRLKNFDSLAIGDNVILGGDAVSFAFDASTMKGKRPIDAPFPAHLLPALNIYLDHYRPILLSASGKAKGVATNALWISRDGTALAGISLHNAIRRRTREAYGKPLPPHWFRDAAVTTLVRGAPAAARLTGSILGHTTPAIAIKHYNQALMVDSARRHAAVIESLLDDEHASA